MMIPCKNITMPGSWGIALDIGYSGVKVFSPNMIATFPAFAMPAKGKLMNVTTENDTQNIFYRENENAQVWMVGKCAQNAISTQDPDTSSMAIYGRQRYFDPMFLVLARTAMALAMTKNEYGDPDGLIPIMETGLPNTYLKADSALLKEVLEGFHSFDLKVGTDNWRHYEFTFAKGNVAVMPQPLGTLMSVGTGKDGRPIPAAGDYYSSSVLICDPGFGTMDFFSVKGLVMGNMETFDTLGMKQVLLNTSEEIFNRYRVEIPVPAMQKYLDKGYITKFDRKTRKGENIDFSDILEKCSREVAMNAVDKISTLYQDLLEYKYFVVTGGTGEAWMPYLTEAFGSIPDLTIIPGNQNTDGMWVDENGIAKPLPFIFSNVRGYYMYLYSKLQKGASA